MEGADEVRRLVHEHGWATLVTAGPAGLQASHLPFLLAGDGPELTIEGHMARANPQWREFGDAREALVVFQGAHGYISPSWYEDGPFVPTWNYSAVHVHGVPEILSGEAAFSVLRRTVRHFESALPVPWELDSAIDYARRIAPGTVAFVIRATRVEAKAKLSQDKPDEVRDRVVAALDADGPYRQSQLAEEMRRIS